MSTSNVFPVSSPTVYAARIYPAFCFTCTSAKQSRLRLLCGLHWTSVFNMDFTFLTADPSSGTAVPTCRPIVLVIFTLNRKFISRHSYVSMWNLTLRVALTLTTITQLSVSNMIMVDGLQCSAVRKEEWTCDSGGWDTLLIDQTHLCRGQYQYYMECSGNNISHVHTCTLHVHKITFFHKHTNNYIFKCISISAVFINWRAACEYESMLPALCMYTNYSYYK